MKLQAVHTIIRRPTKGKEVVHAPDDSQKGVFECSEEEGQTYLDAGAARLLEDGPQKPARKQSGSKSKKKDAAVDPAAVPGQSGETGADDDSAGGTNSDAEGGSDEDLMG